VFTCSKRFNFWCKLVAFVRVTANKAWYHSCVKKATDVRILCNGPRRYLRGRRNNARALLLFQACRGYKLDAGVKVHQANYDAVDGSFEGDTVDGSPLVETTTIPAEADFLIGQSTVTGTAVMWRARHRVLLSRRLSAQPTVTDHRFRNATATSPGSWRAVNMNSSTVVVLLSVMSNFGRSRKSWLLPSDGAIVSNNQSLRPGSWRS